MASKEELDEIRAVGKGSRGGKGSRARRNGGKKATRNPSADEADRSEQAIEIMVETLGTKMALGPRAKLTEFLQKEYQFDPNGFGSASGFWDAIISHDNRLMVRRADEAYMRAIILIYAIFMWVRSDDNFRRHILMIAEKAGIRVTPRTEILNLIARLVINYDERVIEKNGTAITVHDRRALSRDVRVIEWIMEVKKWPPYLVMSKYKDGGSIDRWSREPVPGRKMLTKYIHAEIGAKQFLTRKKREITEDYFDDGFETKGKTKWEDFGKNPTDWERKQAARGDDMTTFGVWENQMLRYCTKEMSLQNGEVMLIVVEGDRSVALEAKVIGSRVLGPKAVGRSLSKDFVAVADIAKRLMTEKASLN